MSKQNSVSCQQLLESDENQRTSNMKYKRWIDLLVKFSSTLVQGKSYLIRIELYT